MSTELTVVDLEKKPDTNVTLGDEEAGNQVSDNGGGYKTVPVGEDDAAMFSKRKGLGMTWRGLNFTVKGKEDFKVLDNVSGRVESGQVCAIMGPSGSGKSSLLNVLAGRSATGGSVRVNGTVKVGGIKVNPVQYRTQIAYVMQDDALMATATPREALRFSAGLRLTDVSQEQIEAAVTHTLKALGIEDCADTFIGNQLIKGISGGQRKRTSVGIELITQPSLLFLDEPTSGLDSHTAYTLVKLLKQIAASNASILCTIHQPSSEVFFLFDSCIFLKRGQVLYQGPVNKLLSFFSSLGYECPQNYNPADYVMFLSQTENTADLQKRGIFDRAASDSAKLLADDPDTSTDSGVAEEFHVEVKSSPFMQIKLLFVREFTNTYRNIPALMGRFGVTIVLSLIFGLIFGGAGDTDNGDQDDINSHFGAMTMVMISAMFGAAQPTLLEFPAERPMFMREYSTGTYNVFTYSVAKMSMEVPILFLQVVVQFLLVYFMIQFQGDFIILVLGAFGTGVASSSLAVLLGCLVDDVKQATEMAPLLLVPQILFAGFFIRTSLIPVYLRWAQYLCALKYGLNIALMNEFSASRSSCQTSEDAAQNCARILDDNGIEKDDWWVYVLVLAALFFGLRAISMTVLAKKAVRFY